MRKLFAALLSALGFGARATEMRQNFAPDGAFSIMTPTTWVAAVDKFEVTAPNNGPSLGGLAYRINRRPSLKEFSDEWFAGFDKMGVYKQVGEERFLEDNSGGFREFEGVWPGDTFVTYDVVAYRSAGNVYACVSLVTSKNDYIKNRSLYEKMLSTLEVHQ